MLVGSVYVMCLRPRGPTASAILRKYPDAGEICATNVAMAEVRLAVDDLAAVPAGFYRLSTQAAGVADVPHVLGEAYTTLWIRPDREIWLCPDRERFKAEQCWGYVRSLPTPALVNALSRGTSLDGIAKQFGRPKQVAVTQSRSRFGRTEVVQLTATWQSFGQATAGELGACQVQFDLAKVRGRWVTTAGRWSCAPGALEKAGSH